MQINDAINSSIVVDGSGVVSVGIEATHWPEQTLATKIALDDLIAGAFSAEGNLRILIT